MNSTLRFLLGYVLGLIVGMTISAVYARRFRKNMLYQVEEMIEMVKDARGKLSEMRIKKR